MKLAFLVALRNLPDQVTADQQLHVGALDRPPATCNPTRYAAQRLHLRIQVNRIRARRHMKRPSRRRAAIGLAESLRTESGGVVAVLHTLDAKRALRIRDGLVDRF